MKNNKIKMWLEVTLIIFAGLVTIGLSINAVIKNNTQEIETKKYQDKSTELQNDVNLKTDEIINLNNQLKGLSENHAKELKYFTKPIPKNILLSFEAEIKLSNTELLIFKKHFHSKAHQSNIITMDAFNKFSIESLIIEHLLKSGLSIDLKIKGRNSKEINTHYSNQPIKFFTFPPPTYDAFIVFYRTETNSVFISGSMINPNTCNSDSYTLYDFEDYEIKLDFGFFNPILVNGSEMFGFDKDKLIKLKNLSAILTFENKDGYKIVLPNFFQIKENMFKSKGILGLN